MRQLLRQSVTLSLVIILAASTTGAQAQATPIVDVVSIRRNLRDSPGQSTPNPTGHVAINVPFFLLIGLAYPVRTSDAIIGAPDWFYDESYDVIVRFDGTPTAEQRRALWRNLLAERLGLKARLEQRMKETYALVLARKERVSSNLKRTAVDCSAADAKSDCTRLNRGVLTTQGLSMAALARTIQPMTGRMVLDQTGLDGTYAFNLTFSPTRPNAPIDPDAAGDLPNIFTALQEQLGLRLQPTHGPVDVLIVEHIERPQEN